MQTICPFLHRADMIHWSKAPLRLDIQRRQQCQTRRLPRSQAPLASHDDRGDEEDETAAAESNWEGRPDPLDG